VDAVQRLAVARSTGVVAVGGRSHPARLRRGEAEVADRDRLEVADLDTAVAAVAGAVQDGGRGPGQALAADQQGGLIGLEHEVVHRRQQMRRAAVAVGGGAVGAA